MRPKVKVFWGEGESSGRYFSPPIMWVGHCMGCKWTTQYWNWGATMGAALYHRAKDH